MTSIKHAALVAGILCLWGASALAAVGSGLSLGLPQDVAFEPDGNLVVSDSLLNAIVRVDPITGDRTILSDAVTGRGRSFTFGSLRGIAIDSSGSLLVVDNGAIVRVDASSGKRTIVSDNDRDDGPSISTLIGAIGVEQDGSIVHLSARSRVIRIDPVSGDRTIVSDNNGVGMGPPFGWCWSMAVAPTGEIIVAAVESNEFLIFGVNPITGDRTILSRATESLGGSPSGGMTVAPDGSILLVHPQSTEMGPRLLRIDPVTGNRTVISDASRGTGPLLIGPQAVARSAAGVVVVLDHVLGGLVRVDEQSGDRMILSGGPIGNGPHLARPNGIAVERDGDLVVTNNFYRNSSLVGNVFRVDPSTGDREIVSDDELGIGTGPSLKELEDIVVDVDGTLLVLSVDGVMRIDPVTGDRTIVSDRTTGSGAPVQWPSAIALEPEGTLVVVDRGTERCLRPDARFLRLCFPIQQTLLRIDPVNGDRTVVSGGGVFNNRRGRGVPLKLAGGVASQPDGTLAVGLWLSLARVDPVTGDREVLSGRSRGDGRALIGPTAIAVDSTGHLVVTYGSNVMRVDPGTGNRVLLSGRSTSSGISVPVYWDVAVLSDGSPVIPVSINVWGAVVRVDPATGERWVISR